VRTSPVLDELGPPRLLDMVMGRLCSSAAGHRLHRPPGK
jgi:hypothetical protein